MVCIDNQIHNKESATTQTIRRILKDLLGFNPSGIFLIPSSKAREKINQRTSKQDEKKIFTSMLLKLDF
jgi:hypothetical protein